MIDWIIFAAVAVIPAAFVWLHMHHKASARQLEHDISELWSYLCDLESKAAPKDEDKD